jgi:hypothetical protein
LGLGLHTLRASAPGYESTERTVRVEGHEDASLAIRLERLPAPPPPTAAAAPSPPAVPSQDRTWTWVAAGGALALGAVATGFGLASNAEYDDLRDRCRGMPAGVCQRGTLDTSTLSTLETLCTVSAVGAGAAAVAAITLFFIEGPRSEKPTAARTFRGTPQLRVVF